MHRNVADVSSFTFLSSSSLPASALVSRNTFAYPVYSLHSWSKRLTCPGSPCPVAFCNRSLSLFIAANIPDAGVPELLGLSKQRLLYLCQRALDVLSKRGGLERDPKLLAFLPRPKSPSRTPSPLAEPAARSSNKPIVEGQKADPASQGHGCEPTGSHVAHLSRRATTHVPCSTSRGPTSTRTGTPCTHQVLNMTQRQVD